MWLSQGGSDKEIGDSMELSRREHSVLNRTVERYIRAGEPVASKQVARSADVSFSPATVRTVMADLEDADLLDRSHPSAGCVPTDRGFRVYLDSLSPRRRLANSMRRSIEERISASRRELIEDLEWVARLVADITKEAGVAVRPMGEEPVLEAVSLVPVGGGRVLGVIVTAHGSVEKRVLSLEEEIGREELERLAIGLGNLFRGETLASIREHPTVRGMTPGSADGSTGSTGPEAELGIDWQRFECVARKLFAAPTDEAEVLIAGTDNLLMSPDFEQIDRARSLMVLFEDRESIVHEWRRMFSRGRTQVVIGRESELTASGSLAMVATLFFRDGHRVGALGVVGPRRMNYLHVVPVVEFIGDTLTEMLDGCGAMNG